MSAYREVLLSVDIIGCSVLSQTDRLHASTSKIPAWQRRPAQQPTRQALRGHTKTQVFVARPLS
jgi:hypothetical protein